MFLTAFLVLAAIVLLIYYKWEYSSFVKTIDLMPGPKKVPIFGSLLEVPRDPQSEYQFILKELYFSCPPDSTMTVRF